MRRGARSLVELTSWLTQHLWEFFAIVPVAVEFEGRLEELNGRAVDPSFAWADAYTLRFFPDMLASEPRGLLPPGFAPSPSKEPLVKYTFAVWANADPSRAPADDGESSPWAMRSIDGPVPAFRYMRRDIIPDLFGRPAPTGIARKRLALLAEALEKRIPGCELQHFATVPSGKELVSVFVDLKSLDRVAGMLS